MKVFVTLCVALAVANANLGIQNYHEAVGIPMATRIREAEEAAVQSGSRIIGGQPAPLGAHPYLAGLLVHFADLTSVCGSSILSNTRAITAAHCWVDAMRQTDYFTMVFGSEFIFFGGERVTTSDVLPHNGWNPNNFLTLENDIAIIRFNHVAFTNFIQPIALPTGSLQSNDFVGVWAQASGYGLTGDGAGLSVNQVQSHVTLQVIENSICRAFFGAYVTERIICTSGAGFAGSVGVCSSDSGGPLSIVDNGRRVLIGVVSFGSIRCEAGDPSGFVRVTEHLPWIQQSL